MPLSQILAQELGCADMGPGRLAFGGLAFVGPGDLEGAQAARSNGGEEDAAARLGERDEEWDALSELPRRLLEGGAALRDIAALRFVLPLSERVLEQAARRRKAAFMKQVIWLADLG